MSETITPENIRQFARAADPEYAGPISTPPVGQRTTDGQEVQPPLEEIRVDGTTQLAIDAGGKQPTKVVVTLTGGKATVNGHYRKGDRITGTFEAVVDAYSTKDKVDKQTGIVTEASAVFGARVVDLTVD